MGFWLGLLTVLTGINTLFLVAISLVLSKLLSGNFRKPRRKGESGLVGLQDEKNSSWWGPHISYRDEILRGPNYDGISPKKPNFDGITIRDVEISEPSLQ